MVSKIRLLPEYKSTPIAAATAYAFDSDRERILSSGYTHYLSKPFPRQQLIDLLEEIFSEWNILP